MSFSGYDRIAFENARARADTPVMDGLEVVTRYEGPHGPAWTGFADEDRTTVVFGDRIGTWRFGWGPGRSFLDLNDRQLAIDGFTAEGPDTLTLTWLHRYRRRSNAVQVVGAGGRWVIRARALAGIAVFRSRDDLLAVHEGRARRIATDATPTEVAITMFTRAAAATLVRPDIPAAPATVGGVGPA